MHLCAWLYFLLAPALWLAACDRSPLIAEDVGDLPRAITAGTADTGA